MTPSEVTRLKLVQETLDDIRFRDWSFQAGDIHGSPFFRAIFPSSDPFSGRKVVKSSRPNFLPELRQFTRLEILRAVRDAVMAIVVDEVKEELLWHGCAPFARPA